MSRHKEFAKRFICLRVSVFSALVKVGQINENTSTLEKYLLPWEGQVEKDPEA